MSAFIGIGETIAVIAKIRNTLKIFEPTTLPTAISTSPFFAAITDVKSSGSEVPSAIMLVLLFFH